MRCISTIRPRYLVTLALLIISGCSYSPKSMDDTNAVRVMQSPNYEYLIGSGDRLNIFVWRNPDLSIDNIPVRPDGRISTPLVEDTLASGQTPEGLARQIEEKLSQYIKDPIVTVAVVNFVGRLEQQVRVIGEAVQPRSIPYVRNMSLLDVMIVVGGLTEFSAGNKAVIVRNIENQQTQINVRLHDLIKGGDVSANIEMAPGDILVIPESFF